MRPMLAGKFNPDSAKFPLLVTPKVDGVRFYVTGGTAATRSGVAVRNWTACNLPDGIDGELMPDGHLYLFDLVTDEREPYWSRVERLRALPVDTTRCTNLIPEWIFTREELVQYEEWAVSAGFEGVIVRRPDGLYRSGCRSTTAGAELLKWKRFTDAEATIVSCGHRTAVVRDILTGSVFNVGCAEPLPIGTLVTYRTQAHGIPYLIGVRPQWDMPAATPPRCSRAN